MTWKTLEELLMHVAALAAITLALLIATGVVHAQSHRLFKYEDARSERVFESHRLFKYDPSRR